MDETILERVPRLSWGEIQKRIVAKQPFEAISPMGTALLCVRSYERLVTVNVHSGRRVREELQSKMAVEEPDRIYEEDTFLDQILEKSPIQIIALDSRFEYDLNRVRDQAVYMKPFQSWGKKVWRTPPNKEELEISLQKYDEFHELLEFVVDHLEKALGSLLILDVHAYNWRRPNQPDKPPSFPVFDLVTTGIDRKKHAKFVDGFMEKLRNVTLPGVQVTVGENLVFKGPGAVAKTLAASHDGSPVLSLEVKKVYMDELTGKLEAPVANALGQQLLASASALLPQLP